MYQINMENKCPKCSNRVDLNMDRCGKCGYDLKKIFDLIRQGDKFLDQQKYPDAFECYEKAIKLDKKNALAWYGKGNVLLSQGKNSEGVTYCVNCQLSPVLSEAFYKDAIKCYEKSISINSKFKNAWYQKAIVLDKLGQNLEAKKCFEVAENLDKK